MSARALALAALAGLALACGGGGGNAESGRAADDGTGHPEYRRLTDEARAAHESGDLRGALRSSTRALTLAPNAQAPYEAVSQIYLELGRDDEAVEFFTLAADKFPQSSPARLYRGIHAYRLGHWDDALDAYEEAARLDPSAAGPPFRCGAIHQAQGRFDDALASFREAYGLEPGNAAIAVRIARLERITGDYEAARRTVSVALQRMPGAPDLHYASGQLYLQDGEADRAEDALRRALSLNPKHRDAHYDLGRLLRREGRDDEGRRHERTARRLEEFLETRDSLRGMLSGRPDDALVPLALAELELTENNHAEALRWLKRAEALGAPSARLASARTEALYRAGDLAAGERSEEALTGVDDGRAALARAAGLLARGRPGDAVPLLEKAADTGPGEREFRRRTADLFAGAGLESRSVELEVSAESLPAIQTLLPGVPPPPIGGTHRSDPS